MANPGRQLVGGVLLAAAALLVLEPRLHLAFEDAGDPRPHRMALTAEVLGQAALGLVISWSERGAPSVR